MNNRPIVKYIKELGFEEQKFYGYGGMSFRKGNINVFVFYETEYVLLELIGINKDGKKHVVKKFGIAGDTEHKERIFTEALRIIKER